MNNNSKHSEITASIIKAFYKVYNTLGHGFLEKVYERAMVIELRKMGLNCVAQNAVRVYYEGIEVGLYSSDIFVEEKVVVELKSSEILSRSDEPQLVNYLKSTEVEVGLLLNFGLKPQIIRKVFTNELKPGLPRKGETRS